jgi:hypothetical protein
MKLNNFLKKKGPLNSEDLLHRCAIKNTMKNTSCILLILFVFSIYSLLLNIIRIFILYLCRFRQLMINHWLFVFADLCCDNMGQLFLYKKVPRYHNEGLICEKTTYLSHWKTMSPKKSVVNILKWWYKIKLRIEKGPALSQRRTGLAHV